MGLWHEQARDGGMPWESNDCQQARYSINADGTVAVLNSQYDPKTD
jgi:lipocalin